MNTSEEKQPWQPVNWPPPIDPKKLDEDGIDDLAEAIRDGVYDEDKYDGKDEW